MDKTLEKRKNGEGEARSWLKAAQKNGPKWGKSRTQARRVSGESRKKKKKKKKKNLTIWKGDRKKSGGGGKGLRER